MGARSLSGRRQTPARWHESGLIRLVGGMADHICPMSPIGSIRSQCPVPFATATRHYAETSLLAPAEYKTTPLDLFLEVQVGVAAEAALIVI
jgi:hypothetical protein